MTKYLFLGVVSLSFIFGFFVYQKVRFDDGKLHIVFCNVGQGDGILIRTPKGQDIIYDGGPDSTMLKCLGDHLPFWDRDIELMILSHPHADHLNGLLDIAKSYKVLAFATERLDNNTAGYEALMNMLDKKAIKTRYLFAGNTIGLDTGIQLRIVGPTHSFVEQTSPNGTIGESSEFGSLEVLLQYKTFKTLLSGDSQATELVQAIQSNLLSGVSVLHVPHHGSKTGLSAEVLSILLPRVAIISVGAHNKYNHPTPFTLNLLKSSHTPVLRTDKQGDIEIISDGKTFEVYH